nr:primosomal replication protein N [Conchiformibius kuhniae]
MLAQVAPLRHSPAGIPVLEVVLTHESWQHENGARYLAKFTLPAKIIGTDATAWQHRQGTRVRVGGFLVQSGRNNPRPMLHIQDIQEDKVE